MTPHFKRLCFIVLLLGAILTTVYLGAKGIFLESFSDLERQDMVKNAERARDIINEQLRQLDTTNGDYSGWDDACRFVQDANPEFVKANLDAAIYPKLRLNLLAYYNSAGRPVFVKSYDHRHDREMPLPESLRQLLEPGSMLLRHPDEKSAVRGILSLPEGPMLVASRPVLPSDYRGPVQGALVLGRFLDSTEVDRLAQTTHLSLAVRQLPATGLPDDFGAARQALATGEQFHVRIDAAGQINSYVLFRDVFNKEALLVRVQAPRRIFQQGKETISYFILWCLAIGVGAAVTIHLLVGRLVLVRRRGEETEERYRAVVERAAEGIVLLDPENHAILEANAAFVSFLGHPETGLTGRNFQELLKLGPAEADSELARIETEKRELHFSHRDGTTLFAEVSACRIPFRDRVALSLVVHDVTERKRFEDQLMHQATHDPLTGLPNRNLFNDRIEQALAAARRRNQRVSLLLIDLDHFKAVNDTLGHSIGDDLLVDVSHRFQQTVRASDTIARLGGDEFVTIIAGVQRIEDLIDIAEHFQEILRDPFIVKGHEIFITASVGIAHYPEDGESGEELFKKADTALYHAKSQGRAGFHFFAPEMNRLLSERLAIETQLRHAIIRDELSLQYQPKFDLASGRVTGAEVLLRWTSAELGHVPPDRFIPVAEDTGQIVQLGEWVMRTACAQLKRWQDAGLPELHLAINLSSRQFKQKELTEIVTEILRETEIDPRLVELELTESLMMSNVEESIARMKELKALGVKISIDDFGTGYSSLNYVGQFPIDRMKIDKSFVQDLFSNRSKEAIIRMIVVMAHSLNLVVTAEGVETPQQLDFLRSQGCEEVQGFLFSRPLPPAEFVRFLGGTVAPSIASVDLADSPLRHDALVGGTSQPAAAINE